MSTTENINPEQKEQVNTEISENTDLQLNEGNPSEPKTDESLNDEMVIKYLKDKGINANSFEDLTTPKIEKIEVDPWKDIIDEDDKRYLEFKKSTGRGRNEFDFINQDLKNVSDIEFARKKLKSETGISNISNEQIDNYLEQKLGIDLSSGDLDINDRIELSKYVRDVKEEHIRLQQEYQKPIQKPEEQNEEKVQLEDGRIISKKDYLDQVKNYNKYLETNKVAVDSVTVTEFKTTIDINGTPQELTYSYEFGEQDKHSMLSITNDTNNILKRYKSEKGFDHKAFNEDAFWLLPENRQKVFNSLLNKALAENTENVLKQRGNVNFTQQNPNPIPNIDGIKMVPLNEILNKR